MTKMILTVVDSGAAEVVETIRRAPELVDGFEIRLDLIKASPADLEVFRRATTKPLIATNRSASGASGSVDAPTLRVWLDAGFDLVDIEWNETLSPSLVEPFRTRTILSFHDFTGFPDVESISDRMLAFACAQTKIAVTPATLDENCRLLGLLRGRSGLTVIGMGASGMYGRILAPFFGSALAFLAADGSRIAAPGQLTVASARAIYGGDARAELGGPAEQSSALLADSALVSGSPVPAIFAVLGHPATHSRSPLLHNEWFRRAGVSAAYSIIDVADPAPVFDAVAQAAGYAPTGISITAPFKEDAFRFASSRGATLAPNARETEAVNTLVRTQGALLADNTDVDGFIDLLGGIADCRRVAIAGAGGTARAAVVAALRCGLDVVVFNRTRASAGVLADRFGVQSADLAVFGTYTGDVLIDTLPVEHPVLSSWEGARIVCRYDAATPAGTADRYTGLDLLVSQAKRQSALFLEAIRAREVTG